MSERWLVLSVNCMLSQEFAGMMTIGSAAGASTTPGTGGECQPEKVLPAINVCGSTDGCYGAEGVRVRDQVANFAAANGCTGPVERRELSSTSYCLAATGCADLPGASIIFSMQSIIIN